MFTISCDQMKKMDTYTIEEIGIPSIVLMETAAIRVVENINLDTIIGYRIGEEKHNFLDNYDK